MRILTYAAIIFASIVTTTFMVGKTFSNKQLFNNSFESKKILHKWEVNQGEAEPILSIEDIQSYLNSLKQSSEGNLQADHQHDQLQYQIETSEWVRDEESLGPVELSRLFFRRVVCLLYQAELVRCSYST